MMGALDIDAVTSHYKALARLVPLKAITRESDYRKAVAALEALLDAGGADERHPLAGLVEALGEVIESYETRVHRLPESSPKEALTFLMQQHGLKQADLTDLAPQSTISAVLAGKRSVSKRLASKLATRFGVSTAVFV
jgi:HTH-type transcriptional regulator/antitoxin HigA